MSDSIEPPKPNVCPDCGTPLSAAVGGLCSRCLMADAAQPTNAPSAAAVEQPSQAEVAEAFPQFEVLELIGAGGMGTVWRARQPKLNRYVALKLLPASLAERDPAFAERFEREGQLLARLHHPNIVTVHDSGRAGSFFYLVMELVDGVNLRQAMRVSRFTPQQALAIVPKICDALQYAHDEGVLHRDIKPENILLDAKGRVKLVDFGIAKLISQPEVNPTRTPGAPTTSGDSLTHDDATLGTPNYMAPEQIASPSDVDHRADIYSLGVVFYELLTGELPVGKFAPPSEKSTADPRLDFIVQQALENERERRQRSVAEMRTQVETLAGIPGGGRLSPVGARNPSAEPVFSRHAIVGACWAPLFFVMAWASFQTVRVEDSSARPAWWQMLLAVTLLPLGVFAPFGTTILGWIGMGQIRRSAGKIEGLGLAVTDGLFFPLLAVIGLLATFWWWVFRVLLYPSEIDALRIDGPAVSVSAFASFVYLHWQALVFLGTVLTAAPVCFFVIRRVWLAANSPSADTTCVTAARTPERLALGYAALFFAVASVLLGAAIWLEGITSSRPVVFSILLSALLGALLAVPGWRTVWGKSALLIGGVNFVIWLLVALADLTNGPGSGSPPIGVVSPSGGVVRQRLALKAEAQDRVPFPGSVWRPVGPFDERAWAGNKVPTRSDADWSQLGRGPGVEPGGAMLMAHAGLGDTFPVQSKEGRTFGEIFVAEASDDFLKVEVRSQEGTQTVELRLDQGVEVRMAGERYELRYPTVRVNATDPAAASTSKAMIIVKRRP